RRGREAEARRRRAGGTRAPHRPAAAVGGGLMGDEPAPRLELLLALADDELILGHRHSEWTGWVPHLEEDLAFSSIAQDEMAHGRLLYGLALRLLGEGWTEDRAALGREPAEYRNAVLCERPNRDWGFSLARQFLYDTADDVRTESLTGSSWRELAGVVNPGRVGGGDHLQHAPGWVGRPGGGAGCARARPGGRGWRRRSRAPSAGSSRCRPRAPCWTTGRSRRRARRCSASGSRASGRTSSACRSTTSWSRTRRWAIWCRRRR